MDALTETYQGELARTRLATSQAVKEVWRRLGSYRDYDVPEFIRRTQPLIQAGQNRAVALTSAYTARKMDVPAVAIDPNVVRLNIRAGVPVETVYERPFIRTWSELADDEPLDVAINAGAERAAGLSAMDVLLASTTAMALYGALSSHSSALGPRVYGWKRVSAGGCCDFCALLDGVVTGPSQPMPVHNNCNCTADPITSHSDLLSAKAAMKRTQEDNLVSIEEHGELGPMVARNGDNFFSTVSESRSWSQRLESSEVPKDTQVTAARLKFAQLSGTANRDAKIAQLTDELLNLPGGLQALQLIE